MSEELVDVVDQFDNVVGRATRSEVRVQKLLHRGVAVLCRRTSGPVLVHRRTKTKDVFPDLYDMFVSGMVSAGESYEQAARRELKEETGIAGEPLRRVLKHRYEGRDNPNVSVLFELTWDGPVDMQETEVAWSAFVSEEELEGRLGEWEFAPDSLEIYRRYRGLRNR